MNPITLFLDQSDIKEGCFASDPTQLTREDFTSYPGTLRSWFSAHLIVFLTPDGGSFVPLKAYRPTTKGKLYPIAELPAVIAAMKSALSQGKVCPQFPLPEMHRDLLDDLKSWFTGWCARRGGLTRLGWVEVVVDPELLTPVLTLHDMEGPVLWDVAFTQDAQGALAHMLAVLIPVTPLTR